MREVSGPSFALLREGCSPSTEVNGSEAGSATCESGAPQLAQKAAPDCCGRRQAGQVPIETVVSLGDSPVAGWGLTAVEPSGRAVFGASAARSSAARSLAVV